MAEWLHGVDMNAASNRRRFLSGCGAVLAAGLAGCFGSEGDDGTPGSPGEASPTDDQAQSRSDGTPVLWEQPLDSPTTRPAVADNTAYVGTDSGTVHALASE